VCWFRVQWALSTPPYDLPSSGFALNFFLQNFLINSVSLRYGRAQALRVKWALLIYKGWSYLKQTQTQRWVLNSSVANWAWTLKKIKEKIHVTFSHCWKSKFKNKNIFKKRFDSSAFTWDGFWFSSLEGSLQKIEGSGPRVMSSQYNDMILQQNSKNYSRHKNQQ
jgi:hypothetical protein